MGSPTAAKPVGRRVLRSWFDSFLERFGSRGPNEWELRSRTLGHDPDVPLAAIDRMRFAADDESPQARTEVRIVEREAATDFVRELVAGDREAAGTFEVGPARRAPVQRRS